MHTDLTQGLIKDHIVKLALPAVIGYFFHTLINITDTFFAGLISTQALAALSLSASVFFMILAIGIGHDVSRYYEKAIKITDVQELGDVMISQLSGLFEKKKLH